MIRGTVSQEFTIVVSTKQKSDGLCPLHLHLGLL
jgi:hypothetical protein